MPARNSQDEYREVPIERVRQLLLTVVSQLDELAQHITVVGGLVPSLLIDAAAQGFDAHVGTYDVDLGIAVDAQRTSHYTAITARLTELGFVSQGPESIRWAQRNNAESPIYIDLIPVGINAPQQVAPTLPLKITEPLAIAFQDRKQVTLDGQDILKQHATASVAVCGPGAFLAIKALAFNQRRLNKDAYDLYYVLHHYGSSVQDVAGHLLPLLKNALTQEALKILSYDFADPMGEGAGAVATFLHRQADVNLATDVAGEVQQLLAAIGGPRY